MLGLNETERLHPAQLAKVEQSAQQGNQRATKSPQAACCLLADADAACGPLMILVISISSLFVQSRSFRYYDNNLNFQSFSSD